MEAPIFLMNAKWSVAFTKNITGIPEAANRWITGVMHSHFNYFEE